MVVPLLKRNKNSSSRVAEKSINGGFSHPSRHLQARLHRRRKNGGEESSDPESCRLLASPPLTLVPSVARPSSPSASEFSPSMKTYCHSSSS
ncbi:hypothetical protein TIFTF001_050027 [Ficus carica]|uniref:Uncharacterized protein n=1 Tax=Ficus carica TaxID=3494 RepID=A0AA87YW65_FICCA|nr:hypothetical protein TIFTF001_050027 [Ficus carica]